MPETDSFAERLRRGLARVGNALLDPTIVLSFDRSGYLRHSVDFDDADLEQDLTEKVCVVTGANSGIGYQTALGLAERGAELWLVCRDRERGERAQRLIRDETDNANVHLEIADLAEQASVRELAERFPRDRIDVLIHNAGALVDRRIETPDGLELTWAVHVVSPFLLTSQWLDRLRAAPAARVITVSSGGMYAERLSLIDLDWKHRDFDGVIAYARAKRAQVVLSELWAEHLAETPITCHAMHPGWADTPGVVKGLPRFHRVTKRALRSPEQGADTVLWLAVCPKVGLTSGQFWFDRKARRTHLMRRTRETASERRQLWETVREQAGLSAAPSADVA